MLEITIPVFNVNDVEYVLVEWLVPAGEPVRAGQPVAVIETSKASQELATAGGGVLAYGQPAGSGCSPGTIIGWVLTDGERPPASPAPSASAAPAVSEGRPAAAGLVLTDAARALVDEHNVPEDRLRALGKRVIRGSDVASLLADTLPVSAVQHAVAATVTAALAIPAAFTVVRIYLDRPADLQAVPELVIRATAAQRSRLPAFFARLTEDGSLVVSPGAQVGITVDTGHGLYLPVLRDAESLSRADISAALLRFRVQARRGKFTAAELAGGNIGITLHTESEVVVLAQPIIHPGHTCALAVCATMEEYRPMPDGSLGMRSYFHLGMAYDHRVVNGRDAVLFLDAIKRTAEQGNA